MSKTKRERMIGDDDGIFVQESSWRLLCQNRLLSWHECHCSECGGDNYLIGKANTKEETWNILEKSGLNRAWYARKAVETSFDDHGRRI